MSFRLLVISKLYPEYLKLYYGKNSSIKSKSFHEQYNHLLDDTSELIAPYIKNFNKLGVGAHCIFTNANLLQEQWRKENLSSKSRNLVFEQVERYKPEVLWIENTEFIDKSWIETLKNQVKSIRLILASHSAPFNTNIINNFKNLDAIFTCTPGLKNTFRKHGLNSYLVYHAFDPGILQRIKSNEELVCNDLIFTGSLFTGSGFHSKRIELIEKLLDEDLNLKIFGNIEKMSKINAKIIAYNILRFLKDNNLQGIINQIPILNKYEEYSETPVKKYSNQLINSVNNPVFGIDMYRELMNSKVTLNIHGDIAGDYAGNMRLYEATGVGSCLLTDNKKNLNELFDVGKEIVVYDSIADCIEKAKWLMNNDKKREEIAIQGQKRTLMSHNIESRCKLMIDIINKEMKSH